MFLRRDPLIYTRILWYTVNVTNLLSAHDEKGCSSPFFGKPLSIESSVMWKRLLLLPLRSYNSGKRSSTEVPFLRATARALGTMRPCQEHRGETSLMFTLACHASFLLLCHRHVCQVLFTHNVAIQS